MKIWAKQKCALNLFHTLYPLNKKQGKVHIARDIISTPENEPKFLKSIVTEDETCVSNMTMQQNDKVLNGSQKIHHNKKKKKNKENSIQIKTMLITFFDDRGIIHKGFFPTLQTVTGRYYLAILKRLMARYRRIHPEYWTESSWVFVTL
ncbi:hypothetical protein TNCV_4062681 [Trichonephila clavipes]|nr:hypothetical protein TNCV_4062681 [Trichonephila clavipes]